MTGAKIIYGQDKLPIEASRHCAKCGSSYLDVKHKRRWWSGEEYLSVTCRTCDAKYRTCVLIESHE